MPRTIDIPVRDLTGERMLVTGGSDGIGLHLVERLARAGAEVVMPVRNRAKGDAAARTIREHVPAARLDVRELDLASQASVARLADELLAEDRPLHAFVHNAGVMTPPTRRVTEDGFELQLATNHLGPVALTTRLLPLLRSSRARVVTQVSIAANQGAVAWDDLQWERRYDAMAAYSSSKIAVGLFAMELERRSAAHGWGITSLLSHPGIAPTNLLAAQPGMGRPRETASRRVISLLSRLGVVGTARSAALPAVYAATSPDAQGGHLYGPSGFQHVGGAPGEQPVYSRLTSPLEAARVWDLSLRLVGARLDA
jgi:NAD(P)-dependent dehydrogenase (short-subunit alcohol dehydrogenase family)